MENVELHGITCRFLHLQWQMCKTLSLAGLKNWQRRRVELSPRYLEEPKEVLLEKLHLTAGGYLTNAAMMLFAKDPEKWQLSAYVKIGYFETDADLIYQDEVHGSLIEIVDKIVELVYLKYMREGILSQLGISPSSAIQMLYSRIVLKKGMPFDLRLPSSKPLSTGVMTREQLDAELQKGVDSIKARRVYSADEVDASLAKEFGI